MKKIITSLILAAVVVSVSAYYSYIHFTVKDWNDLIYKGVQIEDIDLSGKTKEEALNIVKQNYSEKVLEKKINIITDNKTYSLDYNELDARYNINEAVEKAYDYARNDKMLEKYKLIKNPKELLIELKFEYNDDAVQQLVSEITKDINREPIDAELSMVKRGVFHVKPEVVGLTLEQGKLKEEILDKINGDVGNTDIIEINAPIVETVPKYTEEILGTVDELLASYETKFYTSGPGRVANIELATSEIDGTLLLPGEEFSFNGVVGERSAERGYQAAHVILNNKLVDGIGGGICQVSSTLYNSLILANIDPTNRRNHTIASSYVPIGQDATVNWPDIDFKFVNTLEYPIYLEGFTYNKKLVFNVYSNQSLKKWSYKVANKVIEVVEPEVEIVEDPEMYEDEEKIEKDAFNGFKFEVYRYAYEDGVLKNTEVISKGYIRPVDGITIKGTKKRDDIEETDETNLETTELVGQNDTTNAENTSLE